MLVGGSGKGVSRWIRTPDLATHVPYVCVFIERVLVCVFTVVRIKNKINRSAARAKNLKWKKNKYPPRASSPIVIERESCLFGKIKRSYRHQTCHVIIGDKHLCKRQKVNVYTARGCGCGGRVLNIVIAAWRLKIEMKTRTPRWCTNDRVERVFSKRGGERNFSAAREWVLRG